MSCSLARIARPGARITCHVYAFLGTNMQSILLRRILGHLRDFSPDLSPRAQCMWGTGLASLDVLTPILRSRQALFSSVLICTYMRHALNSGCWTGHNNSRLHMPL